mmetsp:Transcript_51656/g.82528  ORF Transcript_51656/g.82528 Transcript_51656/m.82528 type:complete len:265 (-) Transcript_51656:461-1255(-)
MHRFCTWTLDLDLQVIQDTLALTETTHRVIGRRGDAIGGALQVVGDAHLLLIKSPNLLQVLHRFGELILRVVHPTIELSKGDAAITISIQVHEVCFHLSALHVLPLAIAMGQFFHYPKRVLEGVLWRLEWIGAVLLGKVEVQHSIPLEIHQDWPIITHRESALQGVVQARIRQVALASQLEEEEIRRENLLHIALSNSSSHALIIEDVSCPEQGQGFVKDQPFQGRNHRHHIIQGEAMVVSAGFKQGLDKGRGLVLQDVHFMNF